MRKDNQERQNEFNTDSGLNCNTINGMYYGQN